MSEIPMYPDEVSDSVTIEQQAARIAEMEGDLVTANGIGAGHCVRADELSQRIAELELEARGKDDLIEALRGDIREMKAERDAARKALVGIVASWRDEARIESLREMCNSTLLETCAQELEAALLAAHREGKGKS